MTIDNQESYDLWNKFLNHWPVEQVRAMGLKDYTEAGSKKTFTYWIESELDKLGTIKGIPASKFGIYSRKEKTDKKSKRGRLFTNDYGWLEKYGKTPEEAFQTVKSEILKIITAVSAGDLKQIDEVKLWPVYKWNS